MAVATSTMAISLSLEDLPLELLREILLKYFEDSCTITFSCKTSTPCGVPLTYKFRRQAQIGLVSKHFFNETLLALKQSHCTAIEFGQDVSVWHVRHLYEDPTVMEFAKNVRIIHAKFFFYDVGFAPYQKVAPKLREITLPCDGRLAFPVPDLLSVLYRDRLLSVVQGEHDREIESAVRQELIRTLNQWTPGWRFNGVMLTFSFSVRIDIFFLEDAPPNTELRKYNLALTFENTEERTVVTRKQFLLLQPGGDPPISFEATEETMNRLTELSQYYLDKAAEEMWYLQYLPGC